MSNDADETATGEPATDKPMTDADEHAEPIVVAVHPDRGEAEVTVAHLAANGIEGFVVDEIGGGTVPVDGEAGVAVAVRAMDADLARSVLGPQEG